MGPEFYEGKKGHSPVPPSGYTHQQQQDWYAGKRAKESEAIGQMFGKFIAEHPFAMPTILAFLFVGEFFLQYKEEIILTVQWFTAIVAGCYVAIRWLHIKVSSLLVGALTIGLLGAVGGWGWWELSGRAAATTQQHDWKSLEAQSLKNQARDKRYNDSAYASNMARYKRYSDSITLAKKAIHSKLK